MEGKPVSLNLNRWCPKCGRAFQGATLGSSKLFAFHTANDARELVAKEEQQEDVRHEQAPQSELASGSEIPGLYRVGTPAALTTTTTATPYPAVTRPPMPDPGYIVAMTSDGKWGQIPDCGFHQSATATTVAKPTLDDILDFPRKTQDS